MEQKSIFDNLTDEQKEDTDQKRLLKWYEQQILGMEDLVSTAKDCVDTCIKQGDDAYVLQDAMDKLETAEASLSENRGKGR